MNNTQPNSISQRDKEQNNNKTGQANSVVNANLSILNTQSLEKSYAKTLEIIRKQLSYKKRLLSYVIHNKVIEKTLYIISISIARPHSLLVGSVLAFVVTLAAYLLHSLFNYRLSGSETLVAFFIGWLTGVIFDYTKRLTKRDQTI